MRSGLTNTMKHVIGALGALVISLGGAGHAAQPPVAATLEPLSNAVRSPLKLALSAEGDIYVADPRAGGVVILDKYGDFVKSLTVEKTAAAVAVMSNGSAVILQDAVGGIYDRATGALVAQLGSGAGEFVRAAAVAVDASGTLYVADAGAKLIKVYDAAGQFRFSFGSGLFVQPVAVAVEQVSGQVAVVDSLAAKVQFFSAAGVLQNSFSTNLSVAYSFPSAVAFEYAAGALSRTYVVDTYQGIVQSIDAATGQITVIGGYGSGAGKLLAPSDMVFDQANRRLLIPNGVSNIASYGIDGGKNPVKPANGGSGGGTEPSVPVVALAVDATPALTSQRTVTLNGTTDGTTVYIYNGASTDAVYPVNGAWSAVVALAEGVNAISVDGYRQGATVTRKQVSVVLDTTAPAVDLQLNASTANPVQNISGSVIDANFSDITVNGSPVAVTGTLFSTAMALVPGANPVVVVARDRVGNQTTVNRTVTFNPELPQIAIASPVDGGFTNQQTVTVSGSVNNAEVAISAALRGEALAVARVGSQWSVPAALVQGVNVITITVTDQYGNSATDRRTVYYDAVVPDVKIVVPSQDSGTNSPSITIAGTVGDNVEVRQISATVNGIDKPVVFAAGTFSVFVEFAEETSYNCKITVTDVAGNTSTAVRTIIYDKTPPALYIAAPVVPYPVSFNGTVESGAVVTVKDASGKSGVVTTNGTGWSADMSGISYDPSTLTVTATDAVGNATANTVAFPVPDGDVDGDGAVTIKDALKVIKLVVNNSTPAPMELARGDVGPLVAGKPNPNGKLEIVDAILILRKALKLSSW